MLGIELEYATALCDTRAMATTKHTCGGPAFGRKTPGCPRCDELLAGAAPVVWAGMARQARCQTPGCGGLVERAEWGTTCRTCQIRAHDCTARNCGTVCTAFDW
jgi:hypothetical protein